MRESCTYGSGRGARESASLPLHRREFVALLAGAAAWPLAARAQQGDRMRRIGVLSSIDENDPESKHRVYAFTQALAGSGWTDGRNVRMDLRGAGGDINLIRATRRPISPASGSNFYARSSQGFADWQSSPMSAIPRRS
jgi:putative ABC transport system substrate-binding protein